MKTTLKIIQYRDGTWGAKRKGWFGWKYFNYEETPCGGYAWKPYVPYSGRAKFASKKLVIEQLEWVFHKSRWLEEKD